MSLLKPNDSSDMRGSVIAIPKILGTRLRLSMKWSDRLNQFFVQTKLIFSRSILLLLSALVVGFLWITMMENISRDEQSYEILMVQGILLAILLNMNIWEGEREGRTFELLIMRIPNVHRLIWFKLRVSLTWLIVLSLPFFAGYAFFLGVPLPRMTGFFIYCTMISIFAAFLTCVVSTFVPHGLTTGIISAVAVFMLRGFTSQMWRSHYVNFLGVFNFPLEDKLHEMNYTPVQTWRFIILSRLFMVALIAGLYVWLSRRLKKTEKWIG